MSHIKLLEAINSNSYNSVKKEVDELILNGETVTSMGGQSLVYTACSLPNKSESEEIEENIYNIVKLLVEKNEIDIHCKDSTSGETCLMAAYFANHFKVCKLLIDQGVDVEDTDNNKNTVLHKLLDQYYVRFMENYQNEDEIIELIFNKIDIHKRNSNGKTYLMMAVDVGDYNLCKLIIKRGADVNATCKNGNTALHIICAKKRDHWSDYSTIAQDLQIQYDICELLLENNADGSLINKVGKTALMRAVHNVNYGLCNLLISHGEDLNIVSPKTGYTALHYALHEYDDDILNIIELFIASGADVTKQTKTGDDILQYACLQKNVKAFDLLTSQDLYSEERLVESYYLIGSSFVFEASNCYYMGASGDGETEKEKGVSFWQKAVELQQKLNPSTNDRSQGRPKLAFKDVCLLETKEDIDNIKSSFEAVFIHAMIIYYKVLGPLNEAVDWKLEISGYYNQSTTLSFATKKDIMKLLMEIKLERYHLFNDKKIEEIKDFLFVNLSAHYNGFHKELDFLCTDLLDVMEFIIQLIEKSLQNLGEAICEEGRFSKLKCLLSQFPYYLYLFFKTTSTKEDLIALKTLVVHINRIIGNLGLPEILLHVACRSVVSYRSGNMSLNNIGKIFPSAKVVELLLACGADPNAVNIDGKSPLHILVLNPTLDREVVDVLLQYGGHIDQCDRYGKMVCTLLEREFYKVDSFKMITLKCLAARMIKRTNLEYIGHVAVTMEKFIQMH